jgi:hypothetical protein
MNGVGICDIVDHDSSEGALAAGNIRPAVTFSLRCVFMMTLQRRFVFHACDEDADECSRDRVHRTRGETSDHVCGPKE